MKTASIPVDLFNPGQVFACLGFLEAADRLLGNADGGFDWADLSDSRFELKAEGDGNPFAAVLDFLTTATIKQFAPAGYADPLPKKESANRKRNSESNDDVEEHFGAETLVYSKTFPGRDLDKTTLPIRLMRNDAFDIELTHWIDQSSRDNFKLYAGNRSAYGIATAMIHGTHEKPKKGQSLGNVITHGVDTLWRTNRQSMLDNPFDELTRMGGSFNFDPRGGWTAIDAGFSPNAHKYIGVRSSPLVEILAAWGLENARPVEFENMKVRYGVWQGLIPAMLARAAISGVEVIHPFRRFRFNLADSGKNKVVTFATEELNS